MEFNLSQLSEKQLLTLSANVVKELRQRKIVRTNNSPVGDYAEWLIAKHLNLTLSGNSKASIDAVALDGTRYQIKARSAVDLRKAVRLSALRKLDEQGFDFLIAAFFNPEFELELCISLPWQVVKNLVIFNEYTNSYILNFKPYEVLENPAVENLTHLFQEG